MNQAKNKFESLLVLFYKLSRASVEELKGIGLQISDTLQYIERFHLFPIDLPDSFYEQLALMCKGCSNEVKLDISKDLYIYLGRMMYSFEESNIYRRAPHGILLELGRTEFPFEQANDWGRELTENEYFLEERFFFQFNSNHISLPSEEEYQAYRNELRKEPIDINALFNCEQELPSNMAAKVEEILQEVYKKNNEYIDEHYSRIGRAFSTYHKDIRVYILRKKEDVFIVMINIYDGDNSGVTIYPYIVDIMYRFSNVEAIDERMSNSILTYINKSDYSNIRSLFSIGSIHYELNRLFVRYATNEGLKDYMAYILRGRLNRVKLKDDAEVEIAGEKCLLLFSKIPTINDWPELLNKGGEKVCKVVFRSCPDDSVIEYLKSENVSFDDVMNLGQSLINNQNGEMIHWFIKARLDKIQLDDSFVELPAGEKLIKRLEKCPKGKDGWKQYEEVGSDIFHYLFENTFRNYTYEYQSSTSDGIQRRDLVVNNTYKNLTCFWQLVKTDFQSNLIIIDFKNYREELDSNSLYIPTKYFNSAVGYFAIVFSRLGLDVSARIEQKRLLAEKKLVLCLTDMNLIDMINQKMNGQDPLDSLENLYYKLCKSQ